MRIAAKLGALAFGLAIAGGGPRVWGQLPAGWSDQDIGFPSSTGWASFSGGNWTVAGGGYDIWGTFDSFNFAYRRSTNNAVIIAKINSLDPTDPWAKGGVMFRNNTDPSATFAMVAATPENGITFQWRNSYGGDAASSTVGGMFPPVWLKLQRSATNFSGYYSPDGAAWTPIGPSQIVPMTNQPLAGLGVTAHNDAALAIATFSGVVVSNTPPAPPPPPTIFGVYRELWSGISGGTLDALTNNINWPDSPNSSYTKVFTNFETEIDFMDNYGQRVRAFVIPPTNGNYTFWIASDDFSELYLGPSEFPDTNVTRIAFVPGYTSSRQWDKYAEQQSTNYYLEAGRRYYLEARMIEGSGGDNLAVRWQLPDGVLEEPLTALSPAGTRLVPFDGVDLRPGIYQQSTNMTLVEGQNARFFVLVTNRSPVTYQWSLASASLAGATNPIYMVSNVSVALNNGQTYRCVVSNTAGIITNSQITLSVVPDTNPPTVVRILNVGQSSVQVFYSEPVEAASAANRLNYVFTNGLAVSQATLGADNTSVILTTAPLVYGSNYTVIINGVRDRARVPNTIVANTAASFTALPFSPVTIGDPPTPTTVTIVPNGVNVSGSGNDIGGYADQFGFGFTLRSGDFDVAVRLEGISLADVWAKAGLMARETMDSGSRFAATFATPAINGCFFESRVFANSGSTTAGNFPLNYPYTWLRLKRSGNVFNGYAGFDGVNWEQLGSEIISMPAQVYFGLAVSSHNATQPAVGQFRDIIDVTNAVVGVVSRPDEPLGVSSRKTPIVITEIMYKPAKRSDTNNFEFIEVYNSNPWFHDLSGYQLVGDNMNYTFPAGTTIPGGAFLVIAASPPSLQTVYGISGVMGPYTGTLKVPDTLKLLDEQGAVLLTVSYTDELPWPVAASGTGHSLVLANRTYGENDGRAWDISDAVGGSPGRMDPYRPSPLRNVVINEFLAHTDPPDWDYIELYNHANQPVDISGCILTDDPDTNKFIIPNGTVIPARGFAWFSETNMPFALNAQGETIYFKSADRSRVLDAVHFGGQENGVATGRWPDGANDWYRMIAKTPGTNNAGIRPSPVVINELMYHPISGNDDDQYVELYNRGLSSVNLTGWVLGDGISFTFPSNTVIAPDNYLVIARNAARLRTNYANLNPNNCLGDFTGRLAHNGERVTLRMPDTVVSTNNQGVVSTNLIHITVNDVTYGNGGRWGEWSDAGGSSLELINPNSNNRLAANWGDSDETQKAPWANIEVTDVLDNGQNYNTTTIDYAQIGLLDPGECLVDEVEVRPDGWGANVVANPDFETGLADWSLQGCFSRSFLENQGYGGSQHSLHIRSGSRLFTGVNSCQMALAGNTLGDGSTATMRFKARWLRGWPEVLMRLNGNWLEATGRLPVPANLGTPGARNSRYSVGTGPAIYSVTHSPTIPAAMQPVTVTASVHAPGGLGSIQLYYRLDPAIVYTAVPMKDNGTAGDAVAGDGIYTATIPGQFDGTIVAFYVAATDASFGQARFPALVNDGAPDPECVVRFGDEEPGGSFAVYHLWITETNRTRWAELSDLSNEEHDCTMVCGKRVIYNVKARWAGSPYHQGFDTPEGNLCHYKWTFPADDKFLGATSFNKLHQPGNGAGDDTSIQREQLANTFLRKLGVPWLNRRHVVVYVNGNRRGTLMEDAQTPDNDIVEQYFPNDQDGWLYKMQPWFEFEPFPQGISIPFLNVSWCNLMPYTTTGGAKKTARYRYMFLERRTPASANDYTNVFSLVDAASTFGTANYVANMERLADMENWMRVFAANHAAGNWDSYGCQNSQNLYGYMGTQGTRYSLLMFDFNIVIGNSGSWGPGQNLFAVNSQDSNTRNIYNEPAFRRMYWRALQELVSGPLNPAVSGPLLDAKYSTFVMNGLNVEDPNAAIKTWLSQARDSIALQLANVNASGFSLNPSPNLSNNIAFITGTAPVNIRSIWVNGAEYPLTWTSLTGFRVAVPLQPGTTTLRVVGVDMHNQPFPGASNSITAVYSGTVPSPVGQVFIDEISYQPPWPGAEYVELFNASTNATYDLSNWRLQGLAYTFPAGAAIGPRSYLVLAANAAAFTAAYGVSTPLFDTFTGALQTDGETLTLIKPAAGAESDLVVDKVRYSSAAPWPLAANSPGTSLQLVDQTQDHWRVGNWIAATTNMTVDPQWVYVYKTGNADSSTMMVYLQSAGDIYLDDIKLVSGSTPEIGPNLLVNGNFETAFPGPWSLSPNVANSALNTVVKHGDSAALHLVCSSGGNGQSSSMWQQISPALVLNQPYTLSFWYLQSPNGGPLTVRVGSGVVVNVTPTPATVTRAVATPAAANSVAATLPAFPPLWINELQADNLTGITNRAGQRTPWIELYNPTTNTVSLNGIYLANNFTNLMQWGFPAAAVIDPGEFKVVFADGQTALSTLTELHTSFQLTSGGGLLALSRQTTNAQLHVLDYLTYTNLTPNHSYGSFPDAQVFSRQEFFMVTPRAMNIGSGEPITVRINEWMAANTSTILDPVTGTYADWFELYNYGTNAANLAGFYLSDNPTNATKFRIPAGYVIPPHGFLLVWADNKDTNGTTDLHVTFKMDKAGEALGLYGPDSQPIDFVSYGPQTQNVSQGRYPDGSASIDSMIVPTPRTTNIFNTAPILSAIPDQTVYPGQTLSLYAVAVDNDWPAQALRFSLGPGAPPGAAIDSASGWFTWTPAAGPSTNSITIVVTDNGVPNLSAAQTFTVIVSLSPPISGLTLTGNTFTFGFATATGLTYQVEYSDSLAENNWLDLGSPIAGTGSIVPISVDISLSAQRFYRVRVE